VSDALAAGFADGWADPSRLVTESRKARGLIDGSREAIAEIIGVTTDQVHFTPSIHLAFERAIAGIVNARRAHSRILVSAIERDALVHAATFVRPNGVETVQVDAQGHLNIEAFGEAVALDGVAMAAVQHANQELGTVQRLERVYHLAADAGVPLLVDATSDCIRRSRTMRPP
jgi:cysteine desulfurase